MPEPADYRSS